MAYVDDLSRGIQRAYEQEDYEVVQILVERLRQEVGKSGSGDSSFFENIASGLGAGAVGMYESAGLGAVALLEEEEELKARKKIQDAANFLRPEGGDKEAISYKLASGVGSIGALLPTALLGPAALPAAGIIAGSAGAGEASERARAGEATEEERNAATRRGILIGLTEVIPLGRIAKRLEIESLSKIMDKLGPDSIDGVMSRVRNAGATGIVEMAQEASAAILQNLNERGYNPEKELLDAGVIEEGMIGGGAGAIVQVLADLISGKRGARTKSPQDEQLGEEEGIAGLLPAPSDDILVSPTGEAGTREQQEEVRRSRERSRREQEAEDEITLGDMPSAAVRIPREQRDLFPEELEQAERTSPTEISDVEIADAMAERAAEEERTKRIEDDDQIKEQPDVIDEVRYSDFQDRTIAERTAAEDIELAEMQRQEDAAKEVDDLEIERMVIADEDKAGLQDIEAQIKERRPSDPQQPALKDIQKRQRTRRRPRTLADTVAEPRTLGSAPEIADVGKILKDANISEATQALIPDSLKTKPKQRRDAAQTGDVFTPPRKTPKKATTPKQVKTEVEAPVDTSSDIRGSIEFPTAVPRGAEFTNPNDVTAINTLLNKKIPRDEKGVEQTAQTYLKKFKRPADAFTAIAFEIAENTPKFRAQKDTPTSEKAKFAGTGGSNTKVTLQWIENNLSPDAKTEIDRRIVEQQKESTKVEKDVTTRAKQEQEDTKIKQRDTKTAIAVDSATDGKAKVVGTSKPKKKAERVVKETPRAERKLSKEEQELARVADAVEKVQGKAKIKPAPKETKESARERIERDTQAFLDTGGKIDVLNLRLDPKEAVALDNDLTVAVKTIIKNGDLKRALQNLAETSTSKRVKQIARALSNNLEGVSIDIANVDGSAVSTFDPKTNTITLDPNTGMTVHSVLHEATHGATVNILNNKSSPVTKQLNVLYNDVKPYLDTAYGAQNLNDFVAEAFSNPVFQRKLASINPKGEKINALQRFLRTVTNLVRRLIGMDAKPLTSALDAADTIIMASLSPNANTRNSGVLDATPDGVKDMLKDMGDIQKLVSSGNKKPFVKNAVDFLNAGKEVNIKTKEVFMKLTGSQALGDIARNVGFGSLGQQLHVAFERQRGGIQKANKKIKAVLADYDAWVKKNGVEAKEALDRLVYHSDYGATIYQVDPNKPQSDYKGKTDSSGNNLEDIWKAQRKDWNALGKSGQDQFNAQRAAYKNLYEALVKIINGEIDALGDGKVTPQKTRLKKQINERLAQARELEVYFPLVRQGKYKLSFDTTIDGRVEPVFLMFENRTQRDNMLEEVKSDPNTVGDPVSYDGETNPSRFKNAPPESFVSDVLDVISASGKDADSAMQEQIMRLFIESLPETSVAKSLQKRKYVLGYDRDVRDAMQNKGYDLTAQIEKMKAVAEIRKIEKEIEAVNFKDAPKGIKQTTFNSVREEMRLRAKFARTGANNKATEKYFQRSNQLAFIYTIGFNASSALVNLSQIPLVVGPFLSGKFGINNTNKAIAQATKFVGASKLSIDEYYDVKDDVYTLKNSVKNKIRKAYPTAKEANEKIAMMERMIPLVKMANDRGQIYHSELRDQLGVDDLGRKSSSNKALRFLDGVSAASAIMFSSAERFNRQVTLTASYNLILDKMNANKKYYSAVDGKFIDVPSSMSERMQKAAEEALYLTQETNGGAVLETAVGYSQQGIGRIALMYKSYGLQMYYSMIKAGKLAINNMYGENANSELRNMALKQLAGIHLAAVFFAGLQGIPLYGAISMLFDLFYFDDEEDDADTAFRKLVDEGWYKGAIAELTGIDVAGRVRLTGLLLQENRFNKDPSLEESLAYYLGGPSLSTANRLYRGIGDLGDGEIERGLENLAPAGLTNFYRSTVGRYAREGGIRTRRSDPIYDDMTFGDFAAQALGFPPVEYTFRQEQNARNKGVERAITQKRTKLTKKFYVAQRMGDHETMGEVLKDIIAHNKRHPTVPITPEQISSSVDAHMRTSAKMHNGVTVNPLMEYAIMRSNMEYRQ